MKLFAVVVPVSQVERARQCLYGAPPQGVEYAWPATPGVTPSAEVDTRYGFPEVPPLTFAPPVPDMPAGRVTPVTGYGSSLSDNEALEEMSQPTSSGAGVAIALIGVLAAVATAVYFILLKG
jgi:hypothetical protein